MKGNFFEVFFMFLIEDKTNELTRGKSFIYEISLSSKNSYNFLLGAIDFL